MIVVEYDPDTGMVRAKSNGILTVPELRQAAVEIRAALQKARAQHGVGRYLVDARDTVVQPRDVAQEIERQGSPLSHPGDRMAIVVPTTLTDMQSRRLFPATNERAFTTMDAAIAWLRGA